MSVTPLGTKFRQDADTMRDAEQLSRRKEAKDLWSEGRLDDARLILSTVLSEEMSPAVAVQCFVTEAAFCADQGDWHESLIALERAAPMLDLVDAYTQGNFFHQRARVHKKAANIDAALTDYAGASACYEQVGSLEYAGSTKNNLAWIWIELGDLEKAAECIDYTLRLYASIETDYIGPAHDTLANVLLRKGLLREALETADLAVKESVKKADWLVDALTTRGVIKAKMDLAGARADLDEAIRVSEENNLALSIAAACCAVIKTLSLPLDDLISYYKKAAPIGGPEVAKCAEIIIDSLPHGTMEEMKVDLVRRALIKAEGSITMAAQIVDLSHRGVDKIIRRHPDKLMAYRKEPRFRGRPLISKK